MAKPGNMHAMLRSSSRLGMKKTVRGPADYRNAGFSYNATLGAQVSIVGLCHMPHAIDDAVCEWQINLDKMENTLESIKSVISRRRPFLLYAFDVINRNYFALQQQLHPAIPQGHDMTVTFLFPASLNRSVEIMKHVASLYAPQSGECLCKIEPVIYSADSELWCVQHSWADQGENAMILDGTRHCNPEHIRSLIKRSAVFRVYNEYDLTNIADAFQCHGEENEEQELKEIKILLPSSGWASRKGECHRHVHAHDDGGSLRSLLGEIEKTLKNGEDVHFKVQTSTLSRSRRKWHRHIAAPSI